MTNQWSRILPQSFVSATITQPHTNMPNLAKKETYLLHFTCVHNLSLLVERQKSKHLKKEIIQYSTHLCICEANVFRSFYLKCCLPTLLLKLKPTCHDSDRFLNKWVNTFFNVILLHLPKKAKGILKFNLNTLL